LAERPSGTVTFLFTDVEGSTGHWERHPAEMRSALAVHDEILRSVIEGAGGAVFATGGDGFAAAFGRADSAVATAVEAQRALAGLSWPDGLALRVRMGLQSRRRGTGGRCRVPTFTHSRDIVELAPETLIDGAEEVVRPHPPNPYTWI
jgi:class 3 adenylate cyclase